MLNALTVDQNLDLWKLLKPTKLSIQQKSHLSVLNVKGHLIIKAQCLAIERLVGVQAKWTTTTSIFFVVNSKFHQYSHDLINLTYCIYSRDIMYIFVHVCKWAWCQLPVCELSELQGILLAAESRELSAQNSSAQQKCWLCLGRGMPGPGARQEENLGWVNCEWTELSWVPVGFANISTQLRPGRLGHGRLFNSRRHSVISGPSPASALRAARAMCKVLSRVDGHCLCWS